MTVVRRHPRKVSALAIIVVLLVVAGVAAQSVLAGNTVGTVDVGSTYYGVSVAADPAAGLAYAVHPGAGLAVIDLRDGHLLRLAPERLISAGSNAVSVAVAPRLDRLYLVQGADRIGYPGSEVDILDARTLRVLYRRHVRNCSGYVAVDEALGVLLVANQTGVTRLDARTGKLLGWTWSAGPNALAVDRASHRAVVPVGGVPGRVTTLDARTGRVVGTAGAGSNLYNIVVDERHGRAYAMALDTTLTAVDTRTGKGIATHLIRTATSSYTPQAIGSDDGLGRVVVCEGSTVHLFDGRTLRQVAAVEIGSGFNPGPCGLAVDSAAHVAYVSNPGGYHAIDTRTGGVLASQGAIILGGGQVVLAAGAHRVLVGGLHLGLGTAAAVARGVIGNLLTNVFHSGWAGNSPTPVWSLSTLRTER